MRLPRGPQRIVCLTEEPTEILYALGESERIVGISAYTVRPPEAKRDKPVVSAFLNGSVAKIEALEPDLVIGFSDIQADLARDLIAAHQPVVIFNQRSLDEILEVVLAIGSLVGRASEAQALCESYLAGLDGIARRAAARGRRPRVYFEEWDEPMISGIQWVSELIELAGGEHVFADRAAGRGARDRFVTSEEVVARDPELILASWCGKPVDIGAIRARPGWGPITAVRGDAIVELPPEIVLQPGPACLTDGVAAIADALDAVVASQAS